jgi:Cysteine rich repeat
LIPRHRCLSPFFPLSAESPHFVDFFRILTYAEDSLRRGIRMSQQPQPNRILAGAVTFIGVGLIWIVIANNLPSQQELSAKESPQLAAHLGPGRSAADPVLDLSIPGVPPPKAAMTTPATAIESQPPATAVDPRKRQIARLRCEAEVEQLCPEAAEGSVRRQCLETHAQRLPAPCQEQLRERLVKWKEERSRLTLACQADIKRFCPDVRPRGGYQVQCLQQHAQELSDGCYGMLPKGALYFKQ